MNARRLSAVLLALTIACGGEGPTEARPPTPTLAIVSGDSQTVAVTDTLPFDAEVQVMRGGEPVPDQLVDWRVLEDDAGEPFVSTTRTDSQGVSKNRVVAGTRAHTHPEIDGQAHIEVRWIEQSTGESIVEETIAYRVLPGAVDSWAGDGSVVGTSGSSVEYPPATDPYGNPVSQRVAASAADSFPVWRNQDTTWVHRPSAEVVNIAGTDPATRAARTIEDALNPSETQHAAVCLRVGTAESDSLMGVALVTTGPNMGIRLETHWGRDDFKSDNSTRLLGPEHCP